MPYIQNVTNCFRRGDNFVTRVISRRCGPTEKKTSKKSSY